MDSYNETKLSEVDPTLANTIRQLAAAVSSKHGTIQVISGFRSFASQAALYANRANNKNPVAVPGTSKHEKGLAVDLRISGISAQTVGALGESMDLRWGGRFSKPDPGHFELASGGYSNGVAPVSTDNNLPGNIPDGSQPLDSSMLLVFGIAALGFVLVMRG